MLVLGVLHFCCDIWRFFQCILNVISYAFVRCKLFSHSIYYHMYIVFDFRYVSLVISIMQTISMILTYQLL
jgi:hypothetical protein